MKHVGRSPAASGLKDSRCHVAVSAHEASPRGCVLVLAPRVSDIQRARPTRGSARRPALSLAVPRRRPPSLAVRSSTPEAARSAGTTGPHPHHTTSALAASPVRRRHTSTSACSACVLGVARRVGGHLAGRGARALSALSDEGATLLDIVTPAQMCPEEVPDVMRLGIHGWAVLHPPLDQRRQPREASAHRGNRSSGTRHGVIVQGALATTSCGPVVSTRPGGVAIVTGGADQRTRRVRIESEAREQCPLWEEGIGLKTMAAPGDIAGSDPERHRGEFHVKPSPLEGLDRNADVEHRDSLPVVP